MTTNPTASPEPADDQSWHPWLLNSLRECAAPQADASLLSQGNTADKQPKELGAVGFALALAALLLLAYICNSFLESVFSFLPFNPAGAILARILLGLAAALTYGRLRNLLIRRRWRTKARSAVKELERSKKRPVFYLRSFALDELVAHPPFLERYFGTQPMANPEQKLTQGLRRIGPVIAIGRPGEALPALGAARFYVSHDQWKAKVADVAKVSQLVVWATGVTQGLRWEISHLLQTLPPEKLVLFAHPHLMHLTVAEREKEWTKFRETLGAVFPKPLPETLGDARFICFGPDWEPLPIAPPWRGPLWAIRSFFSPLRSALRAVRLIKLGKADARRFVYIASAEEVPDSDFAQVIGAAGPKIRWGRVAAFLLAEAAFLVVDRITTLLQNFLPRLFYEDFSYMRLRISEDLKFMFTGDRAYFTLAEYAAFCACAIIAFRYIRNWVIAAAVTAAGVASVACAVYLLQTGTDVSLSPDFIGRPKVFLAMLVLGSFVWNFLVVGGMVLGVRRLKPLGKGLWVGAICGEIVAWVVLLVPHVFLHERHPYGLVPDFDLLAHGVFALCFCAALKLFDKSPSHATPSP